jgi:hypothetical protein
MPFRDLTNRKDVAEVVRSVLLPKIKQRPVLPSANPRRDEGGYLMSCAKYRENLKRQDDEEETEESEECVVCTHVQCEDLKKRIWVNCDECEKWVHKSCVKEPHSKNYNLVQVLRKQKKNPNFSFPFVCPKCCKLPCCE